MSRLFSHFRKTVDVLGRAASSRRDREHLQELPDHLLRDIGLDRSEIAAPETIRKLSGAERWESWG
ncbi:MAG: DUF1127 domain-containing protein [Pararhizobium sp.]